MFDRVLNVQLEFSLTLRAKYPNMEQSLKNIVY